ncbi:protein cereblon [Puntigrus tetrazona]|uniref:protein cereblon n=1 Tax=Puntigrus tetrazona TaxID=1606681 RepID=UPI001C8A8F90|nr:protein cereblon [Puntigrus tetrazona]
MLPGKFPAALYVAALCCDWVRLALGCPGLLLCRSCGHEVAEDADLRFVPSRLALSHRNHTAVGGKRVSVQLFENPRGFRFEVVTFARADVLKHWPADPHFTWYPGHAWTVATCPRCKTHLGWAFQPSAWPRTVTREEFEGSDRTFVALVIDRLLQERFASALLMTPKSFRS